MQGLYKSKNYNDDFDDFNDSDNHNNHQNCEHREGYIYLHGVALGRELELAERFRRGERWLFEQFRDMLGITRSQQHTNWVKWQLWYNALTHSRKRNLLLNDKEQEKIVEKLRGYGIGLTWHTFGI
ncbi:hypothetical protein D6_00068 [Faustovirus]|nr:hypothetical protein D6_00068 [Faustovirus]